MPEINVALCQLPASVTIKSYCRLIFFCVILSVSYVLADILVLRTKVCHKRMAREVYYDWTTYLKYFQGEKIHQNIWNHTQTSP